MGQETVDTSSWLLVYDRRPFDISSGLLEYDRRWLTLAAGS